jgi:molybdopterin synthase catalytic subunit
MIIQIRITEDPIEPGLGALIHPPPGEIGAYVEFRGVVRDTESGQAIRALRYEAYSPMAEKVMRQIIAELGRQHPCSAVTVIHRYGVIPAGQIAIYVGAWAAHRQAAFGLVMQLMDRLKQEAPIWKVAAIPF